MLLKFLFAVLLLLYSLSLQAQPLFYQLESDAGKLYILGGTEIPADMVWQSETIETAMSHSTDFWTEVPVADPELGIPTIRSEMAPGPGLPLHPVAMERGYGNLQLRDYFDVSMGERSVIESQRLNLGSVNYGAMEPWLAWFTFYFNFIDTLDTHLTNPKDVLYRTAVMQDKRIHSLFETRSDWYLFLASMNDFAQTHYFQHLYNLMDAMRSNAISSRYNWTTGQPDTKWVSNIKSRTPYFYTFMFERRNAALAEQLINIIQTGGVHFLYLDVDHLVGEDSVIRLLEVRGLALSQLQ